MFCFPVITGPGKRDQSQVITGPECELLANTPAILCRLTSAAGRYYYFMRSSERCQGRRARPLSALLVFRSSSRCLRTTERPDLMSDSLHFLRSSFSRVAISVTSLFLPEHSQFELTPQQVRFFLFFLIPCRTTSCRGPVRRSARTRCSRNPSSSAQRGSLPAVRET